MGLRARATCVQHSNKSNVAALFIRLFCLKSMTLSV